MNRNIQAYEETTEEVEGGREGDWGKQDCLFTAVSEVKYYYQQPKIITKLSLKVKSKYFGDSPTGSPFCFYFFHDFYIFSSQIENMKAVATAAFGFQCDHSS